MKITSIIINIETNGEQDKDLAPKTMTMNGDTWTLPQVMFPRDIRFVNELLKLVKDYNVRNK